MNYYYLTDVAAIRAGDEWTIDSAHNNWYNIFGGSSCIGHTPKTWDQQAHCEAGWKVRRKITTTKLGNHI